MKSSKDVETLSISSLVLLSSVTVCLGFFFMITFCQGTKSSDVERVPRVIDLLFSGIIENAGDRSKQQDVLQQCLDYSKCETESLKRQAVSYDYYNFAEILDVTEKDSKVFFYRVEMSADGFVIVCLYDIEDNPIYPKVGLAYSLDQYNLRITDYTFGRLQPFSTRDEEYVASWN